jgi:hypothetical protein
MISSVCITISFRRAVVDNSDRPDQDGNSAVDAVEKAAEALRHAHASLAWHVWRKWEVFDYWLLGASLEGGSEYPPAIEAAFAIKADLMRLGIGDGA